MDKVVPAADLNESRNGQDDGTAEQNDGLQGLGVHDGVKPAEDGVGPGDGDQHDRAGPEVYSQEGVEHDRACIDRHDALAMT